MENKKLFLIGFQFLETKFFELELDIEDNLVEMKQIILDHFFTNFYENISFYNNNTLLDIHEPLNKVLDEKINNHLIEIKLHNYDKKSSKNHIERVKEFVKKPETYKSLCNFEFKINCCQINFEGIKNSYSNENLKEFLAEKIISDKKIDLVEVLENSSLKEIENIENSINFEPFNNKLLESIKIFENEKIPNEYKNNGYFFLIEAKTMENEILKIGSSAKGFNVCNEKNYYYSLLKLFSSKSEIFKQNILKLDYDKINLDYLNTPLYLNNSLFFDRNNDLSKNYKNWNQLVDTKSFFNKNSFSNRDWNEEIQQAKSIVSNNSLDTISKNRVLKKLYNDFLESFTKGVKLIGDKELIPFALSNKEYDQCFLYNNIFYTYVMESDNSSSFSGPNAATTWKVASADINSLSYLNYYNFDGIHFVASAIADFKGKRILGQALIHGINNYDSSTWVKHGLIEEENNIVSDEKFKVQIDKIVKSFNLKTDLKFKNNENKDILISGSPEIKGILANDKRYYLLDLIRFHVRDLNWTSEKIKNEENIEKFCQINNIEGNFEKKFGSCLIRNELINNFFLNDAFTEYYKNLKENPEEKEFKLKLKEQLFFNSTIETNFESQLNEEEKKNDLENLNKLSDFLLKSQIPNFIKEYNNNIVSKAINTESLSKLMHKFGINNRYLGEIYKLINEENFNSELILKSIIIRSLKKYIRKIMREVKEYELKSSLSHIFNIIFGNENINKNLNEKVDAYKKLSTENNELLNFDKDGMIINNNKKKKQKNNLNCVNEFTCIKSDELLQKILIISKYYFRLENTDKFKKFEDFSFLKNKKNKMNFLYEICTCLGIKLQQRKYNFDILNQNEFIFKSNDFVDFNIKIKNPFAYNEEYKNILNELNQLMEKNQIDQATELISNNLNLLLTINGVYNDEIINLMNNVNKIIFKKNEHQRAIKYGFFILNLIKKFYGITSSLFAYKLIELGEMFYYMKEDELCVNFYVKAIGIYDLIGGENNLFSINLLFELEKIISNNIELDKIFILSNDFNNNNKVVIYILENILKRIGESNKTLKFQINQKLFNYYISVDKTKAVRIGIDVVCNLNKIENPSDKIKGLIDEYKKIIKSIKSN